MPERDTPWKPGDSLTADRLSKWAAYTSGQELTTAGGLNSQQGPHGNALARSTMGPITAKLSGASSPYSWTSQVNSATNTFVAGPRTGTTNAYEVNATAGLNNKIVRLYPDSKGRYNFQAKICCGTTGCGTGTLSFHVTGCFGASLSGATVSVTGPGGFSASGTTDGSGNITFSIVGYPAGSYNWSVSAPYYTTATGTKSATCTANSGVTVALTAVAGTTCSTCCPTPLPDTIYFDTPFGSTATLTRSGSSWFGSTTESISCVNAGSSPACLVPTTGPVTFLWSSDCNGQVSSSPKLVQFAGGLADPDDAANYYWPEDGSGCGAVAFPGISSTGVVTAHAPIPTGTCYPFYNIMPYDLIITGPFVTGGSFINSFDTPYPGTYPTYE